MKATDLAKTDCHNCGYDMSERAAREPCPECGTPHDTRTDSPGANTRSWAALTSGVLAGLIMPFVALISLTLLVVAFANLRGIERTRPMYRIRGPIAHRIRLTRILLWFVLVELFALLTLHTLRPEALNWW
ncbi:MAG: hypothetical protein AAGA55_12510 [Planctomycetota bacterium]